MIKRKGIALLLLLAIVLQLGAVCPAYAEEAEPASDMHFENTAEVLFYDERGGLPPREFLIDITEIVSGRGIPSPENPWSITGYDACRILHDAGDGTQEVARRVPFPAEAGIVCGGTYDAINGILVVTRAGRLVQGIEDLEYVTAERCFAAVDLPGIGVQPLNSEEELATLRCDRFVSLATTARWDDHDLFISKIDGANRVCLKNEEAFTSMESAGAWFAENPTFISYALEEPISYYVDTAPVLSYPGVNRLRADTGRIRSFTGREAAGVSEEIRPVLRILAFGNSFTYSTLSYLPMLLEELMPETEIVMGVCYDGGCSLARHIAKFNGGDPERSIPAEYEDYSEYLTTVGKWVRLEDRCTPQQALDRQTWDIIVLQQSVENLHDFDSLPAFADLIADYLTHPALFVYNMAQARHAGDTGWLEENVPGETGIERSDRHYAMIADYAERALATPYISAVLPGATAVQNLRSCSFAAETGDSGYFSQDEAGHLQQGIGPLCAAYAAACRLAEICRELPKVYGLQFVPTDEWVAEKAMLGANGPCVGINEENLRLAKICAMLAIKEPFTLSDCSVWERVADETQAAA